MTNDSIITEYTGNELKEIAYSTVTAAHLKAAAKYRLKAAKSYELGDFQEADLNYFAALRHLLLAGDV